MGVQITKWSKDKKKGRVKRWMGSEPVKCDVCQGDLNGTFVDGKTRSGPWGILCSSCHRSMGVGLGTGQGQQYKLDQPSGDWIKVAG